MGADRWVLGLVPTPFNTNSKSIPISWTRLASVLQHHRIPLLMLCFSCLGTGACRAIFVPIPCLPLIFQLLWQFN